MPPDRPLRVGVTAVGSGIGHSIIQSCRMASRPWTLIGFDCSPMAFDGYECDEFHSAPLSTDADYSGSMLRLCQDHRIDILVPGLDTDLITLSGARDAFRNAGTVVLVGGIEFIRLCRDKLAWSRVLHPLCPAIIPTWEPTAVPALLETGQCAFPLLAKPSDGSGSSGVRIVRNRAELETLPPHYIVQPYVVPDGNDPARKTVDKALQSGRLSQTGEVSLQLAYAPDGRLLGTMATRNRLKDGVPVEIIPIDPAPFVTALEPALRDLLKHGMCGPVNVQGRMTPGGPLFFEMNGRFTGITALRAMTGFNEVEALVSSFMGLVPRPLRGHPRRIGLRQVTDRVVDVGSSATLQHLTETVPLRIPCDDRIHVMVTGAGGWLGRHLVEALANHRAVGKVTALVRSAAGLPAAWRTIPRLEVLDLTNAPMTEASLAHVELVYHLAFSRPPHALEQLSDSLDFTRRLAAMAAKVQVPRFLFASSQAVYGLGRPPFWSEDLTPAPETPYGMAKLGGEQLTAMLKAASPASRVTSVRLARLYGLAAGLRGDELPHRFSRQAACGETLTIKGGDQSFDLIHLRDAVRALLCFVSGEAAWSAPVVNVGSGRSTSILDMANMCAAAARSCAGRHPAIVIEPAAPTGQQFGLAIERFRLATGWQPRVTLNEGLTELVFYSTRTSEWPI